MIEKIKEVIVVEGRDDTRRLIEVFGVGNVDTIETNGSAINDYVLKLIQKAHQKRGVIVFTDPDFSGEKIRKIITQYVPTIKHAFLPKSKALPNSRKMKRKGKSVGVEHALDEDIREAISRVRTVEIVHNQQVITKQYLIKKGLIGLSNSNQLRRQLCDKLNIGQVNGKQLEKRLNLFNISEREIETALQEILNNKKI